VRLLTALSGEKRNVWAVGDARQSIYRFRGASSYNLDRFGTEDFPGGKRGRLSENYRSFGTLLTAALKFAADMIVAPDGGRLVPTRGEGAHPPQMRRVETGPQEPVAIADAIEEMIIKRFWVVTSRRIARYFSVGFTLDCSQKDINEVPIQGWMINVHAPERLRGRLSDV
jgi:superfamily I DNA/RNA helicase